MTKIRNTLFTILAVCLAGLCVFGALAESMDEPLPVAAEAVRFETAAAEPSEGEPAEEPPSSGADVVVSAPADAVVEEVSFELGGDDEETPGEAPEAEAAPAPDPEANATEDDEVYSYDCPDVCDLETLVTPSDRIYPGRLLWPLKGQEALTHITSHVGWRNAGRIHAGQGGTWPSWLHHGIDVGGVGTGQVVVAVAPGIAYANRSGGSGNYVVIDHGNGWYTRYQHLSRFAGYIRKGCKAVPVCTGDPIGYVGNSGGDYPVHLHFEIVWSPDGPGSDDRAYQRETHNRTLKAYSFPQERVITMRWADRWEICTAEDQVFVNDLRDVYAEAPMEEQGTTALDGE